MENAMTSDSASRVTRSSRSLRLAVMLFLGALAAATVLRAQEPPKATATPPAPAPAGEPVAEPAAEPPVTPTPAEAEAAAPAGDKAAPATATDRKPASAPSGRFEPTEKVRADFDVSFPVDI
jgi:cytoskeletal protein RodZ